MKKKLSLRNLALISVPILAAAAALLVFEFLPKDSQFLLEGAVEIASHTCYTKAGGTVESVLVQAGQQVHTGDVLAVIDDGAVDDQIAQLRQTLAVQAAQMEQLKSPAGEAAALAARGAAQDNVTVCREALRQAESALTTARQDLSDQRQLYDIGAISGAELRQFELAAESAQSQVVTAQAQLSAAQNSVEAIQLPSADEDAIAAAQEAMDLTQLQIDQLEASREDYSIRAAADGVVIGTSLEPGVTVVPGQSVFQLSAGDLQYFVCYLPQEYLDQIVFGEELVLYRQGSQEEAARGTVTYIDLQAVYPPEDYENSGNRNQRSVKVKAELTSGGPFAVGQTLFLRLDTVQD